MLKVAIPDLQYDRIICPEVSTDIRNKIYVPVNKHENVAFVLPASNLRRSDLRNELNLTVRRNMEER